MVVRIHIAEIHENQKNSHNVLLRYSFPIYKIPK